MLTITINLLTALTKLDLGANELTETPNVASLIKLERLDLSHNRLTAFPEGIGSLAALRDFDI